LEGGIQKEQKVRKIIACVENLILEATIKKHPLLQSNKHFPYNEACVIEIREEIDIALVENLQVMINHPLPTQDPNLY
jgi:hypothetical protein